MNGNEAANDFSGRSSAATGRRGQSLRRPARLTAVTGIVNAALILRSFWALAWLPSIGATDTEGSLFYASDDQRCRILVGLFLMPFARMACNA
jgi:hypothetical protein